MQEVSVAGAVPVAAGAALVVADGSGSGGEAARRLSNACLLMSSSPGGTGCAWQYPNHIIYQLPEKWHSYVWTLLLI